jgi:hypothetical protein
VDTRHKAGHDGEAGRHDGEAGGHIGGGSAAAC